MSNFIVRFPNGGNVNLSATVEAALIEAGFSASRTYALLAPFVTDGTMQYSRNVGNARQAWPMDAPLNLSNVHGDYRDRKRMGRKDYQHMRCMAQVYALLRKHREDRDERTPDVPDTTPDTPDTTPDDDTPDTPDVPDVPDSTPDDGDEISKLWHGLTAMRDFCEARGIEGNFVDSARADFNGKKMVKAGIPADAIFTSVAAGWTPDTRTQFQAQYPQYRVDYDPCTFGERLPGLHRATPYLLVAIKSGADVWLHGGTGTLKSSGLRCIADELNLDYYELALAGQLGSALTGRDTRDGYVGSQWTKWLENGGLMLLDEGDKGMPNIVAGANNTIDTRVYFNPLTGEAQVGHEDCRLAIASNTLGYGPTKDFPGSIKQEESLMDRFRHGRVRIGRDNVLVKEIFDRI